LQDIWSHAPQNSIVRIDIHPASSTQPQLAAAQNGGQADGQAGGQILLRIPAFTPNGIGFVLDADQHLVIPCFVDPAEFHGPIRVQMGDERMATATFVGSDEKTNLTVLKLRDVLGKPAKLNAAAPEPGTLLMVISLNPALNRLAVWPGWAPDFATIITDDGHVAGFTNGGRFFLAGDYQPVVHELITFGQVRRPVLGVVVEEVDDRDPQRADPALGNTPALRIIETLPGYPATLAGIKKGDLILGLGDQPAGDKFLFSAVLARQQGKTDITIFRDHAQMHFTLDLTPP
jgi:hypothetical protein